MTLTPDDIACLRRQIRLHEGFSPIAYRDTQGLLTIAYGRLIDPPGGLSIEEGEVLLANDMAQCDADLKGFAWYAEVAGPRKHALLELRYQLGATGFREFRKMLAEIPKAIVSGDWTRVAAELFDSKLAREDAPKRAADIAEQLKSGGYP
jgi:GH24 family phage-related lysozyme (muramidase)